MNQKLAEKMRQSLLTRNLEGDLEGAACMVRLLYKPYMETEVVERLNRVAKWFELPHPTLPGRDLTGECDFVAHRLVRASYCVGDKLPQETLELIHRFFTRWDFESKYKAENHMLLFHEARYLYALKYPESYFVQYEMTAGQVIEEDRKFLQEFIRFRAQRGWAEFDSYGYAPEVFGALLNLYDFGEEQMRKYAEMSANVILLDMLMDCSKEGYYGGAHGRIYEYAIDAFDKHNGMYLLYQLYFGEEEPEGAYLEPILSDFRPADYVYDVLEKRPQRWENRECKHLHSITYETPHRQVPQVPGNINKRILITPDYMIGGIAWQDDYPQGSEAAWYAHHQQHEWELSILTGPDVRIFTHHPGSCGPEGKEHGYWTGDLFCCCGQFFSHENVAMATYDIPKKEEQFIHARVPFKRLEVIQEGNYLWMKASERIYAALWFSQGISEGREDLRDVEVRSYGSRHGVVCTVATREECGGFEAFRRMVREKNPVFDPESMTLSYGNLKMDRRSRLVDGRQVIFPYETYDSPCVFSRWGSGVIETDLVRLDFEGWGKITKKAHRNS